MSTSSDDECDWIEGSLFWMADKVVEDGTETKRIENIIVSFIV